MTAAVLAALPFPLNLLTKSVQSNFHSLAILVVTNSCFHFDIQDPTGAPVPREKEATVRTSKLPICNNQIRGHLACLRPVKGIQSPAHHLPLSPLENKLPLTPNSCFMQQGDGFSPQVAHHLTPTPFINMRKRY